MNECSLYQKVKENISDLRLLGELNVEWVSTSFLVQLTQGLEVSQGFGKNCPCFLLTSSIKFHKEKNILMNSLCKPRIFCQTVSASISVIVLKLVTDSNTHDSKKYDVGIVSTYLYKSWSDIG